MIKSWYFETFCREVYVLDCIFLLIVIETCGFKQIFSTYFLTFDSLRRDILSRGELFLLRVDVVEVIDSIFLNYIIEYCTF